MFKRYLKSKSGQGMSEYLILVVLIAVGSIAATKTLGATVKGKLEMINRQIDGEVLSPNSDGSGSSGGSSRASGGGSRGGNGVGSSTSQGGGFGGMISGLLNGH